MFKANHGKRPPPNGNPPPTTLHEAVRPSALPVRIYWHWLLGVLAVADGDPSECPAKAQNWNCLFSLFQGDDRSDRLYMMID